MYQVVGDLVVGITRAGGRAVRCSVNACAGQFSAGRTDIVLFNDVVLVGAIT